MERQQGYVYFLFDYSLGIGRLGMSTSCTYERVNGQVAYYPGKLVINKWHVYDPLFTEQYLHKLFKPHKIKASWYRLTPDVFYKYVREASQIPILSLRMWVGDPVKRGWKQWVLVVNGKKHHVEEETKGRSYVLKRLFTAKGKIFYINFKNSDDYIAIKAGMAKEVFITNTSNTQKVKGVLSLQEVSDFDPLVRKYLINYEYKDRIQKKFESYNKTYKSIYTKQ